MRSVLKDFFLGYSSFFTVVDEDEGAFGVAINCGIGFLFYLTPSATLVADLAIARGIIFQAGTSAAMIGSISSIAIYLLLLAIYGLPRENFSSRIWRNGRKDWREYLFVMCMVIFLLGGLALPVYFPMLGTLVVLLLTLAVFILVAAKIESTPT